MKNKRIQDYQIIKSIKEHKNEVLHLSILLNNDLASSSYDNCFIIYDKKSFEVKLKIIEKTSIIYHEQILNGNLFLCLNINEIAIYKLYNDNFNYEMLQRINDFSQKIFKVIELFPNLIITSSYCGIVKIYEKKIKNNKYENVTSLNFNTNCNNFYFTIKNKYQIVILSIDKLIFLNSITFIKLKTIINSQFRKLIYCIQIVNNDFLLIGTSKGILVVNYEKGIIVENLFLNSEFNNIIKLNENHFLTCKIRIECRCKFYKSYIDLLEFIFDEKNEEIKIISEKKISDKNIINSIIKYNQLIITGTSNSLIIIWE